MNASKLNGAGWRLFRHINRYSNMSVLFGSRSSNLSAGHDPASAGESSVARFDESYGHPEADMTAQNIHNPQFVGRQASTFIERSPSSQTSQVSFTPTNAPPAASLSRTPSIQGEPASFAPVNGLQLPSLERSPTVTRTFQPVQSTPVNSGPVSQAGVQRVQQGVPSTPKTTPNTPVLTQAGSPSAAAQNVYRAPTIAPAANPANQLQPALPAPTLHGVGIHRAPAASPTAVQNTALPTIQPTAQSNQLNRQSIQPASPIVAQRQSPQLNNGGPNLIERSPTQSVQPSAQPIQPSVTPEAPQIDRAQQERMGQIATHNPDVVKVPKNISPTQLWNGLSRINDFHASRQNDEDSRTPWERKTVEKKVERPKKLLRKTAIEEVGRPSKKKNRTAPSAPLAAAQRSAEAPATGIHADLSNPTDSAAVSSMQGSSGQVDPVVNRSEGEGSISRSEQMGAQTPEAPSADVSPHTPSLEDVWPVQRLDEPSALLQQSDSDLAHLDPPTRPLVNRQADASADVQQFVNRVESAQPSDSSIDFVPPSRPRPQVKTKTRPVDPFVISREPSASSDAAKATGASPTSEPVQREPHAVQTEIGALPSDLWGLVGDQPPPQAGVDPVTRSADFVSQSAEQSNLDRSGQHPTISGPQSSIVESVSRNAQAAGPDSPAQIELNRSEQVPLVGVPSTAQIEPTSHMESVSRDFFEDRSSSNAVSDGVSNLEGQASQEIVRNSLTRSEDTAAVSTGQPGAEPLARNDQPAQKAHFSSWDSADYRPEAVNRRTEIARQQSTAAEAKPWTPAELGPSSFRPVMRADDSFDDLLNDSEPNNDELSDPSSIGSDGSAFLESPQNEFKAGQSTQGAMVFSESAAAEADGGSSTSVELSTPEMPQTVTAYADSDEVEPLMSQAEPKAAAPIVPLYSDEDVANERSESPVSVSVTSEADDGGTAQAFADEDQIGTLTAEGDSSQKESGLTLYPDDESIAGDAVELKIKIDGGEELLIGFADGNQLSDFVDAAATSDQQLGLMLFASEGGDGEEDFEPVPFLLQRQGEQELMIGYADGATLDAFLSDASEVDRGPTALIYAEQEAADEDLENPAEVHFRSADGDDVLLGFADAEALEQLIQAADEVSAEQDLNELTHLVYGRLRHQLLVENERWRGR
ncbi:MAG: hypothetical protein AB8G95_14295 [Anaerolineae bacterium]